MATMLRLSRLLSLGTLVSFGGTSLLAAPAREIEYSTIAVSGQPVPDMHGTTFTDFDRHTHVSINRHGDVLFQGSSSLGGGGLWLASNQATATLAAHGAPAPGFASGVTFTGAPAIHSFGAFNDRGEAIFQSYASNGASGVWAGSPGQLQLVASSLAQAPGLPAGSTFNSLGEWRAINNAGDLMVTNGELGTIHGDNEGLWIDSGNGLEAVALRGQPLPGTGAAPLFDFYRPEFNNRGEAAFHGVITIEPEPQDRGIWFGKAGSLLEVARVGKAAPGTDGATFTGIDTADINDRGEIAFTGRFSPGTRQKGLWVGDPGSPQLVATTDMTAPGSGGRYEHIFDPVLNDAGEIAFYARIDEPGMPYGLFTGKPGEIRRIMREGDTAPGTPEGVIFKNYPNDYVRLNADGQISVRLFLAGPDVGIDNDQGIWATDHSGEFRLVAREGDPYEVAEGDVRIIQELGLRWSMNAHGQVAFAAMFTDGSSGVFMANVFPEPAAGILALAAGAALLRRTPRPRRPA